MKKWTEENIELLKNRYQDEGPSKLAKELGTTSWSVIAKARRLGIGSTRKLPPKDFEWNNENIKVLKERYVSEGGHTLAKEMNLSLDTIRKKASELGLHTNVGHVRWGNERAVNNESCNIHYFDKWSENMAYTLGFLFADGSISKNLTTVQINLAKKDKSVIEFIKKKLNSSYKIKELEGKIHSKTNNKSQDQVRLTLCSKILVQQLMNLGMKPRKTYNDDPFPQIPDDMFAHFVRGYLDGDGSISVSNTGVCALNFVGSPKFITGLRDSLVRLLGIRNSKISLYKNKTEWCYVVWQGVEDLRKLRDFIYPKGYEFCLNRKKEILEKWLSKPRRPRGYFFGNRYTGSLGVFLNG